MANNPPSTGSPHLITASNWKDPSTYVPVTDTRLFPEVKPYGSEDPMLWIDKTTGAIHAILHDEQGPQRCTAVGRHAFSTDGINWTYAAENAYNSTVKFDHGNGTESVVSFYRRERPHMIIDENGRPTHLSNGAQESTETDRSFTLIVPLRV